MKKSLSALMAVFVMFIAFIGTASADSVPSAMYKAVNTELKQGNYDFDNGSLVLKHVKTIHLNKPVKKVSTIVMAVAEYNTVRDQIFFNTHREAVFYSPDQKMMVPIQTAAKIKAVTNYQDRYKSILKSNVHVTNILILLFMILLIPGLLALVWSKRQHSVLSYKLENDLFDGVGNKKYS